GPADNIIHYVRIRIQHRIEKANWPFPHAQSGIVDLSDDRSPMNGDKFSVNGCYVVGSIGRNVRKATTTGIEVGGDVKKVRALPMEVFHRGTRLVGRYREDVAESTSRCAYFSGE